MKQEPNNGRAHARSQKRKQIHFLTGNRVRMLANGYRVSGDSDDVADLIPALIEEIAKELLRSGAVK